MNDPLSSLTTGPEELAVLLAHGSLNAIFLAEHADVAALDDPAQGESWQRQVRTLNDPAGPAGGGDGIYLIQDAPPGGSALPLAQFFNADGSSASLCGNGMRAVMRLLMDRHGTDRAQVQVGHSTYLGRRAGELAPEVPAVALALPPISFSPAAIPMVTEREEFIDQRLPGLHPTLRFTALAVPNPHLIALVESYDEQLLVQLGQRLASGVPEFPEGINLSFVQPIAEDELFVRTYERGCGLTPSCGSGNVASRSVASRLGVVAPHRRVTLRNSGGISASWLDGLGDTSDWAKAQPYLEGNATWTFAARFDRSLLETNTHPPMPLSQKQEFPAETQAYHHVWQANREALAAAGIDLPA